MSVGVEPRECQKEQDGRAADGDPGDDRPVMDRPLVVDSLLQFASELHGRRGERSFKRKERPVRVDGTLDEAVDVSPGARGEVLRAGIALARLIEGGMEAWSRCGSIC